VTEVADLLHPEARQHSTALDHDRPGRAFDSTGHHRHAIEERLTPQEREMLKFVGEIGQLLEAKLTSFDVLHIVAPPKLMGKLRAKLPSAVQAKIKREINKDRVKESTKDLQKVLVKIS
jgi:protein required for attachment to host cells